MVSVEGRTEKRHKKAEKADSKASNESSGAKRSPIYYVLSFEEKVGVHH